MNALSVNRCNCFALRQASRRITRLYEKHLSASDLTTAQYCILTVVDDSTTIGVGDLADTLGMERTTLLRALQPLQRRAWVITSVTPAARTHRLSLSAEGKRQRLDADEHWRAAQREFEALIGRERAADMREELLALAI